ncbi:MAG: DUF5063 domain-containing protein [Mediterranea sp.]|jgi:hypothetical protein|nr:DUF5063 domain-containing protein [Mediterranea sp.]
MKKNPPIISRNVVEFVTVAFEFCNFVEQAEHHRKDAFIDTMLKLLPLLYLKAEMLPEFEVLGEEEPETFVTEETYEVLRITLNNIMGDGDDYLDVFLQDMKYSDQPIRRSVSEDVSDIYQSVKDFVSIYKLGLTETMHDAIAVCQAQYREYWGQTLVNTLRALHEVKYSMNDNDD